MTKTQLPQTTDEPTRGRGMAWALAILVAIGGAVAGIYFAFVHEPATVVEATPTTVASGPAPTTLAPEPPPTTGAPVATPSDLEIIEEGVAAFYGGDGQRAAELFELSDRTDQQIRDEAAYQAAIGGRLKLFCSGGTDGVFTCNVPYHNAITDALEFADHGDTNRVVVEDGVITEFGFPEHSWINFGMGSFLAIEGRFDGYADCGFGPFEESCAALQLENLDAWVEWRKTPLDKTRLVEVTLQSWYGGDCEQAIFLSLSEGFDDTPASSCRSISSTGPSSPVQMMAFENILGAEVSVEACEEISSTVVSCEVHYSNKMSQAVGKTPAVTTREFETLVDAVLIAPGEDGVWYRNNYPEDTELRESFRQFAEEGELKTLYQDAGCANNRTAVCAQLIEDNLEGWAAWYQTNS